MKILLDTHVFLWLQTKNPRIGGDLKKQLEDGDNQVLFSVASAWELGIKRALGKIDVTLADVLDAAQQSNIEILNINANHAVAATELPLHHRDPFDRMLIGQALVECARLLTSDAQLVQYGKVVQLI